MLSSLFITFASFKIHPTTGPEAAAIPCMILKIIIMEREVESPKCHDYFSSGKEVDWSHSNKLLGQSADAA